MAWGSKQSATQVTAITTTEKFFDVTPTLNPGELHHVEIEANPPATPTDSLKVSVYGTLDPSSENWDDTPRRSFIIDKDIDPNKVSFVITGLYKYRIGVVVDGSTDTYVADMSYRADGVSL